MGLWGQTEQTQEQSLPESHRTYRRGGCAPATGLPLPGMAPESASTQKRSSWRQPRPSPDPSVKNPGHHQLARGTGCSSESLGTSENCEGQAAAQPLTPTCLRRGTQAQAKETGSPVEACHHTLLDTRHVLHWLCSPQPPPHRRALPSVPGLANTAMTRGLGSDLSCEGSAWCIPCF